MFSYRRDICALVGWLLAFWAGALNTVTTLTIIMERVSHLSGRLNDIGMNALLNPADALLAFVIWLSFVCGSFLAGKTLGRIGFTSSLLLVAGGIGLGALFVWGGFYAQTGQLSGAGRIIMAVVLPLAMGFQNALTSLLPRIGRTTHWTGDSTDLGLALAKRHYSLAAHNAVKIFGFVCGAAAMGYLIGVRNLAPQYGLSLVAAGLFFTIILLHLVNQTLSPKLLTTERL